MDPIVKAIFDILGTLIAAFGRPIVEAALGHHGYVPRRVEAIRPEPGHSHAQGAVDDLGGTAPNETPPEEPHGSSTR